MLILSMAAAGLVAAAVVARAQGPVVRRINPAGLSKPGGYTHVVEVRGGRTLYIAGQVALDASGALVGAGDMAAQTKQVFENLKVALAAGGADFGDLVKINVYVTDASQIGMLREIRAQYITGEPPASTFVQIGRLARPEFLIEIEGIAVVAD